MHLHIHFPLQLPTLSPMLQALKPMATPTSFSNSSYLARKTEMCDVLLLLSSCPLTACAAGFLLLLFGLDGFASHVDDA